MALVKLCFILHIKISADGTSLIEKGIIMGFVLICSGIWNMIFALAKWSLASKNRLIKSLCMVNGIYLVAVGVVSIFSSINDRSVFLSLLLSMLLIGMLIDFKFNTEKNTISIFAVFSSLALIVCAIGMTLLADSIDNIIYVCAILTGCTMFLSAPFERLHEKGKSDCFQGDNSEIEKNTKK